MQYPELNEDATIPEEADAANMGWGILRGEHQRPGSQLSGGFQEALARA